MCRDEYSFGCEGCAGMSIALDVKGCAGMSIALDVICRDEYSFGVTCRDE